MQPAYLFWGGHWLPPFNPLSFFRALFLCRWFFIRHLDKRNTFHIHAYCYLWSCLQLCFFRLLMTLKSIVNTNAHTCESRECRKHFNRYGHLSNRYFIFYSHLTRNTDEIYLNSIRLLIWNDLDDKNGFTTGQNSVLRFCVGFPFWNDKCLFVQIFPLIRPIDL